LNYKGFDRGPSKHCEECMFHSSYIGKKGDENNCSFKESFRQTVREPDMKEVVTNYIDNNYKKKVRDEIDDKVSQAKEEIYKLHKSISYQIDEVIKEKMGFYHIEILKNSKIHIILL